MAPRGAALQREIVRETQTEAANFQIVGLTSDAVLKQVATWPATGTGLGLNWPGKGQSQPSRALRRGDIVDLTIWDSQPNSLLATPEQRSVNMHGLEISPDGTIVTNHHGNLTVDSVEGEGTTVRLTLPLRGWVDPDPDDGAEQSDAPRG